MSDGGDMNRSMLVVDTNETVIRYTLGIEALSNMGSIAHDLPTCYRPGVFEIILSLLQHAHHRNFYRRIEGVERPQPDRPVLPPGRDEVREKLNALLTASYNVLADSKGLQPRAHMTDLAAAVAEGEEVLR